MEKRRLKQKKTQIHPKFFEEDIMPIKQLRWADNTINSLVEILAGRNIDTISKLIIEERNIDELFSAENAKKIRAAIKKIEAVVKTKAQYFVDEFEAECIKRYSEGVKKDPESKDKLQSLYSSALGHVKEYETFEDMRGFLGRSDSISTVFPTIMAMKHEYRLAYGFHSRFKEAREVSQQRANEEAEAAQRAQRASEEAEAAQRAQRASEEAAQLQNAESEVKGEEDLRSEKLTENQKKKLKRKIRKSKRKEAYAAEVARRKEQATDAVARRKKLAEEAAKQEASRKAAASARREKQEEEEAKNAREKALEQREKAVEQREKAVEQREKAVEVKEISQAKDKVSGLTQKIIHASGTVEGVAEQVTDSDFHLRRFAYDSLHAEVQHSYFHYNDFEFFHRAGQENTRENLSNLK